MLQRIIGVVLLLAILAAGVVMYQRRTLDAKNPLASELIELERARIEQQTEAIRLEQEKQKQESAKLAAKLAKERAEQERQAKIQATPLVVSSRTLAAAAWYVMPLFVIASGLTGAGVFYVFRRVPVETPFVKASLPVRRAAAIVEKSLTVSSAAEMAKAYAFQEEISQKRLETDAKVMHSLRAGRETFNISNQSALPAAASEQPQRAENVPTFQEILANLDEGDQMIFGYDTTTGEPITGDFSRLYSSFIGGRSGSGKTSALRGLILQSLKTTPDIEYLIHDPHAEHRESLAQTLPKCRQIRFTGANPLPDVRRFAEALQERIDTNTTDAPPLVFVVDELAYCSRQKYFPTFQAMFDRISTEGRKVRVYLLASSQDLRFRKTGDFRDTLSSSFLFNLKSGQVKAFTQDNDLTKLHKVVRVANAPGLALLDLTDGEPAIIKTPFCSPNDARFLPLHNAPAARGEEITSGTIEETNAEENTSQDVLNAQNSNVIPFPKREPANEISTNGEPGAFDVKTLRESAGLSQGKFAELTGCSLSKLKKVETNSARFDADEISMILTNLDAWQQSDEPTNQLRTKSEPGANDTRTIDEPTHTREA